MLLGVWLALSSCGGDGGDRGNVNLTPPITGFVTISTPDASSRTTNCGGVLFGGTAFISPTHFRCCSGDPSDSGVTVRWTNQTSGQGGTAIQHVIEGLGIVLENDWSASIPLVLGNNVIAITASDPAGVQATATATISKPNPSFGISGTLRTMSGTLVSANSSDISFLLSGDETKGSFTTPSFSFGCLLDGSYTVTPHSGAFPFVFSPTSQMVTISGGDVPNIDFQVDASILSGAIKFSNSGNGVLTSVTIAGTPGRFTTSTSTDGSYAIAAPNGQFTIAPPSGLGFPPPTTTFTPDSRSVVVNNADIAGLDFVSP